MSVRGRPPKSRAAKALGGNAGKRARTVDPQPAATMPRCPAHLDAAAKDEWETLAPELFRLGLLTLIDRTAFAAYCQAWANWVHACKMLKMETHVATSDKGNSYLNPWATVATQALNDMNRFGAPFGLTPGARRRLDVKPPEKEDAFEVFVKRSAQK